MRRTFGRTVPASVTRAAIGGLVWVALTGVIGASESRTNQAKTSTTLTASAASVAPAIGPPTPAAVATPGRQEIKGIVLDPLGRPVKGALVYTLPSSPPASRFTQPAPSTWKASDARFVLTGEDGRFVIEYTRSRLSVRAEAPPFAAAEMDNEVQGAALVLKLTQGSTRAGRVVDATTGEPVPGVEVMAREIGLRTPDRAERAGQLTAITDRAGRFVVKGLRSRQHIFTLKSSAFVMASSQLPFYPGASEAILTVRPGLTWRGAVVDDGGRPVEGASILITGTFGAFGASGWSDSRGLFAIASSPGRYTLSVTHQDFAPVALDGLMAPEGAEPLRIQMSVGAVVGGRILNDKGVALGGEVRIRLFGRPKALFGTREAADLSTPKGRFLVPRVPAGRHELDVTARGYAPVTVPVLVRSAQGRLDLGDITLESGLRISGRVVDKVATPVPGVRVIANASNDASRSEPFESESDDQGRFTIVGIREGRYHLSAQAPGYSRLSGQRASSGDLDVTVTLKKAGRVRVRVVHGSATGGATRPVTDPVMLVGQALERASNPFFNTVEAIPDASGEVLFEDLTLGRQNIEIGAAGYVRQSLGAVNVEAGATTDLGQVRLDRGFVVRGSVVDGSGRPVPGAEVDAPFQESNRFFERKMVTDMEGRFQIAGIQPGTVAIEVQHQAFASVRGKALVEVDGSSAEVLVTMRAGGRIVGTLKRRTGEPVGGALVSYSNRDGAPRDWMRLRTATDDLGAFSFANVALGETSVTVMQGQGGRFGAVVGASVKVTEGEESMLNFVLRETLVRGRVQGPASRANLRVSLRSTTFSTGMYGGGGDGKSLPSAIPRGTAFTGDDGAYQLIVDQPGTYSAEVTSYDGSEQLVRRRVDIPDADAFSLDFGPGASRVVVTVVDEATRAPVVDAQVQSTPIGGTSSTRSAGGTSSGSATTGADGRATLFLRDGEYRIGGWSPSHVAGSESLRVSGDTEVTLTLETGLKISGRVRTLAGVAPPGYYVTAGLLGGGSPRSAMRLAGGAFEIAGLRPGTYKVHASAADDFGETQAEAGAQDVDIVLSPGGTVEVLVVDASNRPVSGAGVTFATEKGEPLSGIIYYASDAGRLSMPAPAGPLNVMGAKESERGRTTVLVRPGETVSARVVLSAPGVK